MKTAATSTLRWGALLLAGAACLSGCNVRWGGDSTPAAENTRLRRENLELERELEAARERLALREGQLEAARQRLEEGVSPVEGANPPRLARIELDRYTSAVDTDRDGVDDTLRIYLRPVDGDGRFLPVAAQAHVQLAAMQPGSQPVLLVDRTWSPQEFNAAYRSNFLGTHYTLGIPLPDPLPEGVDTAALQVTLVEGTTGARFTAQQAIQIDREPRPRAGAE